MAAAPPPRFRGGVVSVSSPDIASLTLVKPLPTLARVYIGPWIPAYILSYYAFYHAYDTYIKSIGKLADSFRAARSESLSFSAVRCRRAGRRLVVWGTGTASEVAESCAEAEGRAQGRLASGRDLNASRHFSVVPGGMVWTA